jgi:hypothetical protein
MWPFNRRNRNNQADVPQEVQEYYQSERRERVGVAWLLALATLVITILLAIGLFLGGRWIYRAVIDRDSGQPGTTQTETETEVTPPADAPGSTDGASDEPTDDRADTSQQGTSSTSTDRPATAGEQDERTGSNGELPDTGPGETVGLFLAVTAAATAAHHIVLGRRYDT